MIIQTIAPYIVVLTLLFHAVFAPFASGEGGDAESADRFFLDLEKSLLSDYRLCTGDSSELSLDDLLLWRQSVDSVTAEPDYPLMVRKFTEETGIAASAVRPCEIVRWMSELERRISETENFLALQRTKAENRHRDSLKLARELSALVAQPYDFGPFPFGLSQHGFMVLASQKEIPAQVDRPEIVRCGQVTINTVECASACHFSSDDRYWCYELESVDCALDSLEIGARRHARIIAADFENRVQRSPDHVYRVGRFDIVPGRLAICSLWNLPDATAYVGLARSGNRFYAKMIVKSSKDFRE